jgi:hypothetical protein
MGQMKSKDVRQLDLPVVKPADPSVMQAHVHDVISLLPTIRRIPTLHKSIEFARELSGLEDKEIYGRSGIDPAQFSRMKSGSAWYPQDDRWLKILNTMKTEIPVAWQVEALGYDWSSLRRHQSETERELEAARLRIRELEHDREVEQRVIAQLIGGRK